MDFSKEGVRVPDWFKKKHGLRIMFASGDWVIGGVPNTKEFADIDIHTCYPSGDNIPSNPLEEDKIDIEANLEYIRRFHYHQKLICYLDIKDRKQVHRFIVAFGGYVSTIETLDARIFPLDCANTALLVAELLQPGGSANLLDPGSCKVELLGSGMRYNEELRTYEKLVPQRGANRKKVDT